MCQRIYKGDGEHTKIKTKHYCNEKAITKNTIYSEIPHIKHIAQNDLSRLSTYLITMTHEPVSIVIYPCCAWCSPS